MNTAIGPSSDFGLLLERYSNQPSPIVGINELMKFEAVPSSHSIYNPTTVFLYPDGSEGMLARYEPKVGESGSCVQGYVRRKDTNLWVPTDLFIPNLQDPNISKVHKKIVLSGVRVEVDPADPKAGPKYRTVMWFVDDLREMENMQRQSRPDFVGPWNQKDIRVIEVSEDEIMVVTRPHTPEAPKGDIRIASIRKLGDLSINVVNSAKPLRGTEGILPPNVFWSGANTGEVLRRSGDNNGIVRMYIHLGYHMDINGNPSEVEAGNRCYIPAIILIKDGIVTDMHLMALSKDMPNGEVKVIDPRRPRDLEKIIFSAGAGYQRDEKGLIFFYSGLGDSRASQTAGLDVFAS